MVLGLLLLEVLLMRTASILLPPLQELGGSFVIGSLGSFWCESW